jgi:hypothetical protein
VSVHARKKGGLGSPGAADFDGAVPTALFNTNEEKIGLRRARWVVRDKVLVLSSRMLARIRLTGQLGQRGNEASWHQSSGRAIMAVVEMAFTWEEENGIGGVRQAQHGGERWGVRRSVQRWHLTGSDPGTSAMGGRVWPLKTEEVGAGVWAPCHSAGGPGQMKLNRFQNQFKLIQTISKSFKL